MKTACFSMNDRRVEAATLVEKVERVDISLLACVLLLLVAALASLAARRRRRCR